MTTKTLTVIAVAARSLAVLVLVSIALVACQTAVSVGRMDPDVSVLLASVSLLLGIAIIPCRVLSRNRVAAGSALVLSLVPLVLLVLILSQTVGLLPVWSASWWCDVQNLMLLGFVSVAALGAASLPTALVAADALARRRDLVGRQGDSAEAPEDGGCR